jgi:hypothetical protein
MFLKHFEIDEMFSNVAKTNDETHKNNKNKIKSKFTKMKPKK